MEKFSDNNKEKNSENYFEKADLVILGEHHGRCDKTILEFFHKHKPVFMEVEKKDYE